MTPKGKAICTKYATLVGCILSLLPHGLFMYWGNMSTYSLSYIVNIVHSTANVDTPWIISIFIVFLSIGLTLNHLIANRIGLRWSMLVGAIIADIGLLTSYFAVQDSVLALTCTLGIVMGSGAGLIYGSGLQLTIEWADNDVGRLTALIQGGFSFGGLIINEFVTLYTNPHDLTPKMKQGLVMYFDQREILNQVPSMFLIHGGCSVILHIIGFLMVRQKPKEETLPLGNTIHMTTDNKALDKELSQKGNRSRENMGTDISWDDHQVTSASTEVNDQENQRDYHPKEMIKTLSFYTLWISFFIGDIPFLLLTNYYKSFGQLTIHDDHFLTILGTIIIFLNGLMNVVWGAAMDRFGVKNSLVCLMSSVIIILSWYYFSQMGNRWLYFVVTLMLGCTADCMFPCFTAATALLYGKKHFSTNFGILMTCNIALNVVSPYVLRSILLHFGWFALFASASGLTLISLILILVFIPRM